MRGRGDVSLVFISGKGNGCKGFQSNHNREEKANYGVVRLRRIYADYQDLTHVAEKSPQRIPGAWSPNHRGCPQIAPCVSYLPNMGCAEEKMVISSSPILPESPVGMHHSKGGQARAPSSTPQNRTDATLPPVSARKRHPLPVGAATVECHVSPPT